MITDKFLHTFAKFRIFHSLRYLLCNLVLVLGHKVSTPSYKYPVKYLKLSIIVLLALFIIQPSNASTTNVSILYGWNGTNFVPVQVTDAGAIKTDINLSQSTGLSPKLNNTYDLGQTGFLWANVYVRSIRGGSGPLSLFAGESERLTLLAGGNVGVNSASPQYKFEVGGNANITGELLVSNVSLLDRTQSDNTTQNNAITANNQTLSDRFGGDNTTQNNLITGNNNTLLANLGQKLNLTGGTLSRKLNGSGTDITNNISLAVNNTLYVNTSADRVGVGTSAPTQALHVVGSLNVTGSIWSSDANITAFTNVSIAYGYNGSNFVPLTTTSGGVLKLSVAQSSASHLTGTQSNATSMLISNNLTVLKNLSVGTTTLFVDQTATRVGISTASPSATLEVSGYNVVNNISLNVNNTLYVNNSGGGNVGIGTTAPGYKLDVNGDTNLAGAVTGVSTLGLSGTITSSKSGWFATQSVAGTVYRGMYMENTNSGLFLGVEGTPGGTILTGSTAYAAVINQQANKLMQFGTNNAVRMTIDNTGLVGIGTTSPSAGLQINTSNPTLRTNGSVFIDGSVGIGDTSPGAKLVVEGVNSANNLSLDIDDVFYVNGSNVGIGTAAPGVKLHVNSGAGAMFVIQKATAFTGSQYIDFRDSTGAEIAYVGYGSSTQDDFYISNVQNANLTFQTNGSIRMILNRDGNVGIGTTAPQDALHVSGGSGTSMTVASTTNGNNALLKIMTSRSATASLNYGWQLNATDDGATPSMALRISRISEGSVSDKVTIDTSGNVGIGTTSPSATLTVSGAEGANGVSNLWADDGDDAADKWSLTAGTDGVLTLVPGTANDADSDAIYLGAGGAISSTRGAIIQLYGNEASSSGGSLAFVAGNIDGGNQTFSTGGNERMRITYAGSVGIGTTGPNARLHVNSTSAAAARIQGTSTDATVLIMMNDDTTPQSWGLGVSGTNNLGGASNNGNFYIRDETRGAVVMTINKTTGNVGIGTTSPNYKLDVNGNINATSYRSNGTDYGEWMEKLDVSEKMEEGDVVAVVGGKVTKSGNLGTGAADSYMVVTGRAGYVGNEGCPAGRCIVVSFVGQVPVKVAGKVGRGDYVIVNESGAAIAKPKANVTFEELKGKVLGTAWESKGDGSAARILVAVGVK